MNIFDLARKELMREGILNKDGSDTLLVEYAYKIRKYLDRADRVKKTKV
jgi:hypothetical protein